MTHENYFYCEEILISLSHHCHHRPLAPFIATAKNYYTSFVSSLIITISMFLPFSTASPVSSWYYNFYIFLLGFMRYSNIAFLLFLFIINHLPERNYWQVLCESINILRILCVLHTWKLWVFYLHFIIFLSKFFLIFCWLLCFFELMLKIF